MTSIGAARIAVSGLQVGTSQVAALADNIANARTAGYAEKAVDPVSLVAGDGSPAGVTGVVRQLDTGSGVAEAFGELGGSVDLGQQFGRMIVAESAYKANLATLRTADEMSRGLLDLTS